MSEETLIAASLEARTDAPVPVEDLKLSELEIAQFGELQALLRSSQLEITLLQERQQRLIDRINGFGTKLAEKYGKSMPIGVGPDGSIVQL